MSGTAHAPLAVEEVAKAYFAAWEARDPDRIAALHTEDTRFQIHANTEPTRGRDAVRQAFADLFEQWPNFTFDVHRVLTGDAHWVLDWTLRSSGGPAGDVRFDCLDVVAVEQGLVARKDTFVDLAQLQAALAGA
jgi:ketosteroid isomerase-like protein